MFCESRPNPFCSRGHVGKVRPEARAFAEAKTHELPLRPSYRSEDQPELQDLSPTRGAPPHSLFSRIATGSSRQCADESGAIRGARFLAAEYRASLRSLTYKFVTVRVEAAHTKKDSAATLMLATSRSRKDRALLMPA